MKTSQTRKTVQIGTPKHPLLPPAPGTITDTQLIDTHSHTQTHTLTHTHTHTKTHNHSHTHSYSHTVTITSFLAVYTCGNGPLYCEVCAPCWSAASLIVLLKHGPIRGARPI